MDTAEARSVPTPFIWRRVHSLTGLWLVLYLIEHLIVNSQAALWLGDDGSGFVRLVNSLESLPYLQVIETVLIGIPLLVHGIWGVKRALAARANSGSSKGDKPSFSYGRNRAFTWQRLTSWILLVGIIAHVVQMRFLDFPRTVHLDSQERSMVKIGFDEGLYTLAPRLHVQLFSAQEIAAMEGGAALSAEWPSSNDAAYDPGEAETRSLLQRNAQRTEWVQALKGFSLTGSEVVAVADAPGPAMLLSVRDTFKHPVYSVLYTIFVLAAAFHAFNGFWTFLIAWGFILSIPSQKAMAKLSWVGVAALAFLGLAAIWGSYWLNLRS